jgi:hypothetical protein
MDRPRVKTKSVFFGEEWAKDFGKEYCEGVVISGWKKKVAKREMGRRKNLENLQRKRRSVGE